MGPHVLARGGLPRQKATSIVPRPVSQTGFALFYINVCGNSDDQELPTIIIRIVEEPTVVTLKNRRTYFHFREVQVLR